MDRANEEPATARYRVDEPVQLLSTERLREHALASLNVVNAIGESMVDDLARTNASLFALDNASMANINDAATTMDSFKRLVAAEVKTQVAAQVAAEVKTQVAAQAATHVVEACAKCRAEIPMLVAAEVARYLAANGSSTSSAAAAPTPCQQPPAPKRTGTEANHDPRKRQRN